MSAADEHETGFEPERFVWPPGLRPPSGGKRSNRSADGQRIAVPGGDDLPESPAWPRVDEAKGWSARLRGGLEEAEDVWLGVVDPPLRRRIRDGDWSPDPAMSYCWRCVRSVGSYEVGEDGCSRCRGKRLPWDRLIRLGEYRPPLRRYIHDAKFTAWYRLALDMGRVLGDALAGPLESARRRLGDPIVVPVPTTARRRLWRGIDHSGVIAAGVAERVHGHVRRLLRRKHRPSQLTLPVSERAANVAGTIRPRRAWPGGKGAWRGRLYVVVDDVLTTGATMRGCCRALRRGIRESGGSGGVEVWGAVVAYAGE